MTIKQVANACLLNTYSKRSALEKNRQSVQRFREKSCLAWTVFARPSHHQTLSWNSSVGSELSLIHLFLPQQSLPLERITPSSCSTPFSRVSSTPKLCPKRTWSVWTGLSAVGFMPMSVSLTAPYWILTHTHSLSPPPGSERCFPVSSS